MYQTLLLFAAFGMLATLVAMLRVRRTTKKSVLPKPVLGGLTWPMARVLPITARGRNNLEKDLIRSGYLHTTAPDNFLATRNMALLAWVLFGVAVWAFELMPITRTIGWVFLGVAIVVIGVPRTMLSMSSGSRAQKISHNLPDALDLLAMMMSGGMTINESLEHVIGEFDSTHPALAGELQIVARQANSGSLDGALSAFAERLDLPEVTALTAMLRGGHRAGGSLVEALRNFSDGLRHERDQQARERGNKASIKLLLPVIFCLAPPIYILLLGPAFLDLKEFIEKENEPGGALAPVVQSTQDTPNRVSRSARVGSAVPR